MFDGEKDRFTSPGVVSLSLLAAENHCTTFYARICASSQGAEEGWSVKVGAIAKTAEGKLAVVTVVLPSGSEVQLRFADGEWSGYIGAGSLTQATPSDAGYQALVQMKPQVMAELQFCKAAVAGDAAAIERLAGEGASPDAKNEDGTPAVCGAAWKGHTAAVEALLRLGADPNATTKSGATALMYAAAYGNAECARLLLEAGIDATLRATGGNAEGKTALELAEGNNHAEVAALLRREPEPEPEVTRCPPPHLSAFWRLVSHFPRCIFQSLSSFSSSNWWQEPCPKPSRVSLFKLSLVSH